MEYSRLLCFQYLYIYFDIRSLNLSPIVTVVEIKSYKFNESIYIKEKAWGLPADHQFIFVSKSPTKEFDPDTTQGLVFYGDSFFYKFVNDTLNLYVNKESPEPKDFKTSIKVNQINLTNSELMDLWESYRAKGLKKFEH